MIRDMFGGEFRSSLRDLAGVAAACSQGSVRCGGLHPGLLSFSPSGRGFSDVARVRISPPLIDRRVARIPQNEAGQESTSTGPLARLTLLLDHPALAAFDEPYQLRYVVAFKLAHFLESLRGVQL